MGQGEHGGLYDGFLEGQRRGDHPPEPFELILLTKALDNYVITIGRRFCSLGRAVAREAADLLSIQYYGRDIEEEIAKRMKQPVKEISEVEKDAESRFDVFGNILAQVLALSPLHKGYWSARPIWQSDSEGVPLWRWSRHHFANKGPYTDCAVLL